MIVTRIETPIGSVVTYTAGSKLVSLGFEKVAEARLRKRFPEEWTQGDSDAAARVRAYFAGDVRAIDAIECDGEGTPFQKRVWAALRRIPVGETVSYGELARTIRQPTAVRAVARANALNPIGIVVPCHRVIGSDGKLTGYAGGLERKAWLLQHEAQEVGFALSLQG